ncbi:MAG: serine hydrolase [Chitinophagales bacterium]|nr:serine hydrolase [Chitinophagales bacterium]
MQEEEELYFPPLVGNTWERKSLATLEWDSTASLDLENYLASNGTRAFIILQNGRIVMERYWGNNITNTSSFQENSLWYWASAGKTLTAFLVGIAQEENLLSIEDKSSDYLGQGWTNMSLAQENNIKIKHQLMMTTGLDYTAADLDCTDDTCLVYLNEPGTQWYYHNAPYTLLESVVANASSETYNAFTDSRIEAKTGMDGTWIQQDYLNVYWSTARDAARFALLLLADGTWDGTPVLSDQTYLNQMRNTSQNLNESYGYLTWLNGKPSIIYPGLASPLGLQLSPNAPADLYTGMGKNGQFIEVVPSLNLVVIRMGEAPDNSLVPTQFHDDMWLRIKAMWE